MSKMWNCRQFREEVGSGCVNQTNECVSQDKVMAPVELQTPIVLILSR